MARPRRRRKLAPGITRGRTERQKWRLDELSFKNKSPKR